MTRYFGSQCYEVFGQKFSLYREGSSLFRFNFVPSFSEVSNNDEVHNSFIKIFLILKST